VLFLATKGQHFKHYPISLKIEAVRLHEEEGWSYRKVTEQLGIHDAGRVKRWVKKYRLQGTEGLQDGRGKPHRVKTEQDRKIRRLEMEVDVLKKWLEILNRGGQGSSIKSSIR
jgi:transposase